MTLNKRAVKTAVLILFLSLLALSSCGDLSNSLLSSGGTYQVKALVNGNSLDNCSIIRRDDKIIPYFAASVVNDPDLTGLLVYLKNSKGDIVGEMVLYTIDPMAEALQPETTEEETEPEDNDNDNDNDSGDKASEDNDSGDNDSDGNDSGDNDPATFWTGETETTWLAEADFSNQIMAKNASVDTKSAMKKYDAVILIKSFDQEMPYFQLSKDMEIGQYTLVFEVFSRTTTLSLTELDIFYIGGVEFRLNDISMYLPWLHDTRLIPLDATVMLEAGLDFDSRLNPYVIWYNGRTIISEGYIREGAGTILWKAPEQSGFYSLRLEVLPYNLKRNFTGIFREITIPVSAKASQTGYFFEIEPGYSAKRPLSAGTAYAEQVKLVAAQIAALAAIPAEKRDIAVTAPIPPEHPELIRWYRFDGSLDEVSLTPERMFEPAGKIVPRWASVEQSYGLSAGPDDNYLLRPVNFFRQGQDQGGGIFLFHIRPVTEGTIFSAFFPMLGSASDGVWMDMAVRRNALTLRLKTKGSSVEIPVNPDYSGRKGFIPIAVEFYIRPYRFEAKLSVGEDIYMQNVTGEIRLPGVLAGEGRIKLGVDKTAPGNTVEAKSVSVLPAPAELEDPSETDIETDEVPAVETVQFAVPAVETVQPAAATIWDEFAILYSSTPLLPEEILVDNDSGDSDSVKTEDAQEKEEVKPRSAAAASPVNAETADAGAPVENEAPLADNKAENILMEQASDEAEDEEVQSLSSLP
ncbi:MAG: hypothetical protein LBC52_05525 [Treponema sp.]|jgi:hypothetical protein|nr:hypothetical protein [Treponema sp.]